MSNLLMPTALKDVHESDQIGIDISMRVGQGVTHPGLGGQVDNCIKLVISKECFHAAAIRDIAFYKRETLFISQLLETTVFKRYIIVVVQVIQANDLITTSQKALTEMGADEAGGSGYQDLRGPGRGTRDARRGDLFRSDHSCILAPGLLCIKGAVLKGFSSRSLVLIYSIQKHQQLCRLLFHQYFIPPATPHST